MHSTIFIHMISSVQWPVFNSDFQQYVFVSFYFPPKTPLLKVSQDILSSVKVVRYRDGDNSRRYYGQVLVELHKIFSLKHEVSQYFPQKYFCIKGLQLSKKEIDIDSFISLVIMYNLISNGLLPSASEIREINIFNITKPATFPTEYQMMMRCTLYLRLLHR